jgi:hypothetical protein
MLFVDPLGPRQERGDASLVESPVPLLAVHLGGVGGQVGDIVRRRGEPPGDVLDLVDEVGHGVTVADRVCRNVQE